MFPTPLRNPSSSKVRPTQNGDQSRNYRITNKSYGKDSVKLLHVSRNGPVHTIQEFEMSTHLKLAGNKEYLQGDNSDIVDSDSLKNTAFLFAKKYGIESPEKFGLLLAEHCLKTYAHVVSVHVHLETYPWQRISHEDPLTEEQQPHNHAFVYTPNVLRYCDVILRREDPKQTVISGIKGLRVIKTDKSSFVNFIKDEYCVLPDQPNRILSTILQGSWEYSDENVDYNQTWETIRKIILRTFSGDPIEGVLSTSSQYTLYQCETKVLDTIPQVSVISMSMPNLLYFNFDTKPFQQIVPGENNEVFIPYDKPYGIVYAELSRE